MLSKLTLFKGTFSDFWNGDQDVNFRRTEGPFLTQNMWDRVLPSSGFRDANIMLNSFAEYKEAGVIIAQAVVDPVPRALSASKDVALVSIVLSSGHCHYTYKALTRY